MNEALGLDSTYRTLGQPVTLLDGRVVDAVINTADRLAYDTVTAGDYTLRYRTASATLAPHDPVTIGGVRYVVAGLPERINAHESVAPIMREAD